MARRKDYYGRNNKKTKAGSSLLMGFLEIVLTLILWIFTGLVELVKFSYNSYKNKNKK